MTAKMSKSKKKKLKKREKRNQALMEEAMQHVMDTEPKPSPVGEEAATPLKPVTNGDVEAASEAEGEAASEAEGEAANKTIEAKEKVDDKGDVSEAGEGEEAAAPAALVNGSDHVDGEEEGLQSPDQEDAKSTRSEAMSVTSPEEEVKGQDSDMRTQSEEREGEAKVVKDPLQAVVEEVTLVPPFLLAPALPGEEG